MTCDPVRADYTRIHSTVIYTVPEGTTVRYTLDGAIPTLDNSIPYHSL